MWCYARCIQSAALIVALAAICSAGKLNERWVLPSGNVHVDRQIYSGEHKFCALTFDDGPDGRYTPQVAAVLARYGVHATFFVVGQRVEGLPEQVKALMAAGHEIGNHSYSHPDFARLSEASQRKQIEHTQQVLSKLGLTPRWFRPPYGAYTATTVRVASSIGLETVLWTADPRDWAQPGATVITARVLKGTANEGIILLHCTNPQTVAALPAIIENLQGRGYALLTLSEWQKAVGGGPLPEIQAGPAPKPNAAPRAVPTGPTPQPAGSPASALERMLGTFYAPFADAEARVIEPLEMLSPASFADAVWSEVSVRATSLAGGDAPPVSMQEGVLAGTEPAPPPAPAPLPETAAAAAAEQEFVFANFTDPMGIASIFATGRAGKLVRVEGWAPALLFPGLEETPVAPAQAVPAVPEGEELIIPPESTAEAAPSAPSPPAAQAPLPLVEPQPLNLRIIDLLDFESTATAWQPPKSIDTSDFLNNGGNKVAGGFYGGAKYYFLSMVPDVDDYTWVELETTVRLGRLSGLVLAEELTNRLPQCDLPYPWVVYDLRWIDRGAMIDLTVENVADVMDAVARAKENLFIVVRPSNLNFFISAHTLAEMGRNLRDFILFRLATAALPYDPGGTVAERWTLPPGVSIGRFTDGQKEVLVLYTQSYRPHEVAVPAEYAHFSRVTIDPGGWLRVARLDSDTVTVDASPVILYYELGGK
jgi:peptidoglycan/xylan/chitin deacetylase (PgdA/CDA1 family)